MSSSRSTFVPRRALALLALVAVACASSSGSQDGAASPDDGVDCSTLPACDDKLHCSGGAQCFKLKSCPEFVCASVEVACASQCKDGEKCLVLESQPMLLGCK